MKQQGNLLKILIIPLILLFALQNKTYSQLDPFKWNRLPSTSEINKAKQKLINDLSGTISVNGKNIDNRNVRLSSVIKFHIKKQAGKVPPQDISRLIVYAEINGLMGSQVAEYNLFQNKKTGKFGFAKVGNTQYDNLQKQYNSFIDYIQNHSSGDSDLALGFAPPLANSNKVSSEEENDNTMTVIIGALTAAAVIGLFKKRKKTKLKKNKQDNKKKKDKKDKKDKNEEVEYVLQLNKDHFNLVSGKPQQLLGQVWRVTQKEKHVISANFNLSCAEKNLKISPASASGTLKTQLLLKKSPTQTNFNILLTAQSGEHTVQRQIQISTGKKRIEVKTKPNNSRNLRPNTQQQLTCYARVLGEEGLALDELSKAIKFDGRQSKWLDLSDPIWDDGWAAINIEASDPDANAPVSHPPKSVVLGISVEYKEKNQLINIENNLTINLIDCKIDTNIDQISFPVSDNITEVTLRAFIQDCDSKVPWHFDAFYQTEDGRNAAALTEIKLHEISDTKTEIILTGPIKKPDESERFIRTKLIIQAKQKNEDPLERDIYVMISKEGLYIEDGTDKAHKISFTADGNLSKNIDFGLYVYDEKTDRIVVDKNGLSQLQFELINTDKKIKNLHSVLQPKFTFDELVYNIPYGRYNLESTEEIPGYGNTFDLHYRVKTPITSTQKIAKIFETEIILSLKTKDDGRKHPSWDEAYTDCKHIINTYIPEGTPRNKINALLEQRKEFLDAEGLVGLRQQIWKIAYNLILAEGAEGYKNVDIWANRIVVTLEWTQWAGDIAFNSLLSFYMARFGAAGGVATVAINTAKEEIIEGVNFYIYEDQPIEVFYDRQYQKIVPMLINVTKGHLISIENIEHFVTKNKVLAWTIFIACEYTYNLYETRSMIEAAKATARQIRDELIIRKVTQHLHKNALRYKIPTTDVDSVLSEIKKNVKGAKGEEYVKMDKVLEYMRDPAKVRTLKNHAPDWLKKAFDRTRNKIYGEHDTKLKDYLSEKYHLNKTDIKIDDFRTPGDKGYNLNTDRDYRVLRKVKTNSGKEVWIEIQRNRWLDKSYKTFGELTNKPSTISAEEWAGHHQQRGTDRFDAEASMDYSDHFYDPETGELITTEPNVLKAERGETTLHDAKAMGEMYENKVKNSLKPDVIPEAYAQAQKGVKTLKKVRDGYLKQGIKLPEVSKNLQKAMEIVKNVPTDANISPEKLAKAQASLKKLGYKNIGDVAIDMSNRFKDLSKFDHKVNLKPIYK